MSFILFLELNDGKNARIRLSTFNRIWWSEKKRLSIEPLLDIMHVWLNLSVENQIRIVLHLIWWVEWAF